MSAKTDPSELGAAPTPKAPLFAVDTDEPPPLLTMAGTCRVGTPVGKIYGLLHPKDGEASWDALPEDVRKMWGEMDSVVQDHVVIPAVKHAVREERIKRLMAENRLDELEEERRRPAITRMVRAAVNRLQDLLERWENRGT